MVFRSRLKVIELDGGCAECGIRYTLGALYSRCQSILDYRDVVYQELKQK